MPDLSALGRAFWALRCCQLTPHRRLLMCVEPIDFRNDIDGRVWNSRDMLAEGPFRETMLVFRNRRVTAVTALAYDG